MFRVQLVTTIGSGVVIALLLIVSEFLSRREHR